MENPTQSVPVEEPVVEEAPKAKNKLLIPFIISTILAVAGCGFSIYTLATAGNKDDKTTVTNKKTTVKTPVVPVSDADVDPTTDTIVTDDEGNELITLSPSDFAIRAEDYDELKYRVSIRDNLSATASPAISIDAAGSTPSVLNIHITNAEDLKAIYDVVYSGPTEFTVDFNQSIVDAHISAFGQAAGNEFIFVVLADGTVHYIPVYQSIKNGAFTVAGRIDGLSDIVRILDGDVCDNGCGMQPIAQDINGDIYPIPILNR